ncbi:MAG: AAA family ATPase, partial [Candidatus Binataceae bacterium]
RVLFKGEAGIGKSRLIRQFCASIQDQRHSWFEVFCSPFSINTPFAPLLKELERSFLRRGARSSEVALSKIGKAFSTVGVKPDFAIPAIAEMMGLPLPAGYLPLLSSPEQKRRRFIAMFGEFLLAFARLQPMVVVLEDAQWADPSSLELAEHVTERGSGLPLLLIYTARPEFELPSGRIAKAAIFELGRLTHDETLALIRASAAGAALPAQAVELVAERSGGVPLFVEELAAVVADQNTATDSQIPVTLADSLMARLDRLGAAKEIAQVAAVIGREFSYAMLRAITADSEVALSAGLQRLLDSDVIHARGSPPEARYLFKHGLVRDAAYDSLLRARRRLLHGAVARALTADLPSAEREPERLAYHLSEAGETDAASRAWRSAGDAAAKRGALAEAASHYAKAVEMLGALEPSAARDQREMSLLMTLASALSATKGLASKETEAAYRRWRELGRRSHPKGSTALLGLWQMHVTRGDAIAAQELAEQRLQIAQIEKNPSALCRSHRAVGMTLFHRGRLAQSIEHLRAAVEFYAGGQARANLFDDGPLAMGYLAVALALVERRDEAREMSARALQAAEQLESPPTLAFCKLNCAALHWLLGEPREVLRVAREGAAVARAHSLEQLACGLDVYAGWALAATGDAAAGVVQIRTGIAGWLANGQRLPHAWFLSFLAWASAMAGATAEALEIIDEADAAVGEMRLEETIVWSARAEILAHSAAERAVIEEAWLKVIESARRNDAVLFEIRADIALANLVARSSASGKTRVKHSTAKNRKQTAAGAVSSIGETTKPVPRQ